MEVKMRRPLIYLVSTVLIVCALTCTSYGTEQQGAFVVCIDPGHQAKGNSQLEPVAPGASQKKAKVSSGTAGVGTKKAEHVVNLEASKKLASLLKAAGYEVIMTRDVAEVDISNAERAQLANNAHADMTIRIHCDSVANGGKTGATLLVPSKSSKYTQTIYPESFAFATCLQQQLEADGVKVNGIFERDDMTGFNWSQVPVVIFEMGFMSNWNEDQMLSDATYQQKLMQAVVCALETYRAQTSKVEAS